MSIINDLSRISNAKSDLANAISGKGVAIPEGTKLDGYAELVNGISGGMPFDESRSLQIFNNSDPIAIYVDKKRKYAQCLL